MTPEELAELGATPVSEEDLAELGATPIDAPVETPATDDESKSAGSYAGSALQGATLGFGDELLGAGGGVVEYLRNKAKGGQLGLGEAYRQNRDAAREMLSRDVAEHPVVNFAGGLLTPIPGAGAAKGAIGGAKTLGAAAKAAAKGGAVSGLIGGAGNAKELRDIPREMAIGGALGAGVGGTLGAGARGVGALSEKAAPLAEALASRAFGRIPKPVLNRTPGAAEAVRKFGRETLDAGLVAPFGSKDAQRARLASELDRRSGEISRVSKSLEDRGASIPLDDLMGGIAMMSKDPRTLEDVAKNAALQRQAVGLQEILPGQVGLRQILENKRSMQKAIPKATARENFGADPVGTLEAQKDLGAYLRIASEFAADAVPGGGAQLSKANDAYRKLAIGRKIIEDAERAEASNNLAGLPDYIGTGGVGGSGGATNMLLAPMVSAARHRLPSLGAVVADRMSKGAQPTQERLGGAALKAATESELLRQYLGLD